MTENLLHFIWAFGYYNKSCLATESGESIQIVFPGTLNKNGGPDFTAAKIRIGQTLLAGHVELHLRTSDWHKHGHEIDEKYRTVILHVVYEHDGTVNDIPVLSLASRISRSLLQTYSSFQTNKSFIPCGDRISSLTELTWQSWKARLIAERLTRKAKRVLNLYAQSNNHWDETFWWLLARGMGGKVNGDAFEEVARTIPVNLLSKHKASIIQLEALLLGQANLLNSDFDEDYPKLLEREYQFLQKKYSLRSTVVSMQFLRMRPGAFPTIRLAQLAALVQKSQALFSIVTETENLAEIKALFSVSANDFWHYHYTLTQASAFKPKSLGADAISTIIINSVVPAVFAVGLARGNENLREKAIRWLEELSAETNTVTTGFDKLGIRCHSAYDSQALLELKSVYCADKRCLECSVGNQLLREAAAQYETAERLTAPVNGNR